MSEQVLLLSDQEQRDLWAILWRSRQADTNLLGWSDQQKALMDRLIELLPATAFVGGTGR